MRFLKRNHVKITVLAVLLVIVYNEILVYFIQTFKWPTHNCYDDESCVKILLVADPQILGEQTENPALTYIFNRDSDGFLAKTYARVVAVFKPDVILFLGDLMDEGSIATKEEFYKYVKRLSNIFTTEYPMKHVWIPGDNDIGGENEPIHPEKIKMFNAAFKQPDFINVKYVDIYKTNYLTQLLPESSQSHFSSNTTKIAISHMPLLLTPDKYTMNVLTKIQPAIIFSGHRHSAAHLKTTKDSMFKSKVTVIGPQSKDHIIEVDLKQDHFHEFIVPTCSYRMGVYDVGYGTAVIDTTNQKLQFAVFWSPHRFYHLKLYLLSVTVLALYLLILFTYRAIAVTRHCRKSIPYSKV